MIKIRTRWKTPPSDLADAYRSKYVPAAQRAVEQVGQFVAISAQTDARRNAPWTDRTGAARLGLTGAVDSRPGDEVTVYLITRVPYGKYLELSNGGRYAIIMPTIEHHVPLVRRMLQRIMRG